MFTGDWTKFSDFVYHPRINSQIFISFISFLRGEAEGGGLLLGHFMDPTLLTEES